MISQDCTAHLLSGWSVVPPWDPSVTLLWSHPLCPNGGDSGDPKIAGEYDGRGYVGGELASGWLGREQLELGGGEKADEQQRRLIHVTLCITYSRWSTSC